jgi:hypothetical protein
MGEGLELLAARAPAGRPAEARKLLRQLSSWRQTAPASFTAQNLPWVACAPLSELESTIQTGQPGRFQS